MCRIRCCGSLPLFVVMLRLLLLQLTCESVLAVACLWGCQCVRLGVCLCLCFSFCLSCCRFTFAFAYALAYALTHAWFMPLLMPNVVVTAVRSFPFPDKLLTPLLQCREIHPNRSKRRHWLRLQPQKTAALCYKSGLKWFPKQGLRALNIDLSNLQNKMMTHFI